MWTARRIRRQAGTSAADEFERQKKAWRRRNKWLFRGIAIGSFVCVAASLIFALGEARGWIAGLFAGCALTFWMSVRESPPPWVAQYLVGSIGEERTAKAVQPLLRAGWRIVHDVPRDGFNLDHVLIGPPGVFVLETKNLFGSVVVDGDSATLTRPGAKRHDYRGDWWACQARGHAVDAGAFLLEHTGWRPWVNGVVVLWADFPQRQVRGRHVTFVEGNQLLHYLRAQRGSLSGDEVNTLADAWSRSKERVKPKL